MRNLNKRFIALLLIAIMTITGLAPSGILSLAVINAEEGDIVVLENNDTGNTSTNNQNGLSFIGDGSGMDEEPQLVEPEEGIELLEGIEFPMITPYSTTRLIDFDDPSMPDAAKMTSNGLIRVPVDGDGFLPGDTYELTGTGSVSGNIHPRIVVTAGTTLTLELNNLYLEQQLYCTLLLEAGSNVTIELVDGTTNTIINNTRDTATSSWQAGIGVMGATNADPSATNANLTINGDTGKLIVKSGAYGAGIGGFANNGYGNITINGGYVEATARDWAAPSSGNVGWSGNGSGIGSGGARSVANVNSTGSITINGGTVIATSENNGAGIGGGGKGSNGTAASGYEAKPGPVKITGGTVTAISKGNGAGIGTGGATSSHQGILGDAGAANEIAITGGVVTAISEGDGAGIGGGGATGGTAGTAGTIKISGDAEVTAESMKDGAGIGGGGSVSGSAGTGGNIGITGATHVVARSAQDGAGIGGGGSASGTAGISGHIDIYRTGADAPIIIAESENADDIGPGKNGARPGMSAGHADGTIVITSGNVRAYTDGPVSNGGETAEPANNWKEVTMEKVSYSDDGDPYNLDYRIYGNERMLLDSTVSPYTYRALTYAAADALLGKQAGEAYVWRPTEPDKLTLTSDSASKGKIYNASTVEIIVDAMQGDMFRPIAPGAPKRVDGQVIGIKWFRVPVSEKTAYGDTTFDAEYAITSSSNKDSVLNPNTNKYEQKLVLNVDKNANYWFQVEFLDGDGNRYYEYISTTVRNFYEEIEVFVREVKQEGANPVEEINSYAKLKNATDTSYGIPYDLDGKVLLDTDVNESGKGFGYDELEYTRNPSYPRGMWYLKMPIGPFGSGQDTSKIVLDQDVADDLGIDDYPVDQYAPDIQTTKESTDTKKYYTALYINAWPIVTKTVVGKYADTTKDFEFEIEFTGLNAGDTVGYQIVDGTGGVSSTGTINEDGTGKAQFTFELQHDWKILFSYGGTSTTVNYTVNEENANTDGYTATVSVNGGPVGSDTEVTGTIGVGTGGAIDYFNTKEDVVPTGVVINNVSMGMVLLSVAFALFILYRILEKEQQGKLQRIQYIRKLKKKGK